MTFLLDRSRSFLKIEESNLLSLHRSIHSIVPSLDSCQGHLCEAFICVVQEHALQRVYLALHDQQSKSNHVFISAPVKPDAKKIAALTQAAHAFLEKTGFEMKPININFSAAIREVIIKDVKVMREPPLTVQLDAAKFEVQRLLAEKEEAARTASRRESELKGELDELKARHVALSAPQAAVIAPAVIPVKLDGEETESVDHATVELKLQPLRGEIDRLATALKSAVENLKLAKEEARQARKGHKNVQLENQELREKLQAAQRELDKSSHEIASLRVELRQAGKLHQAVLHEQLALKAVAEAANQAETADLKTELNRLASELAGYDTTRSGEVELLRAALTEANSALSAERAKNESALREMDALERNASVELKQLHTKVDSLTAEKQQLEKIGEAIKNKARGEIERQQQINQAQRSAAIKKLHALKDEIRQLAEARAVMASPTGMPLVPSGTGIPASPADEWHEQWSANQPESFASDPFGSDHAAENVEFLPDSSLKGVPYTSASDVVEVYRSYNTIQAAPSGKQPQRCDGFVCLVTEAGQCRVYVAWLMNSSREVLVCLPAVVAEGDQACRRMLREGITYFERIGFFIDALHLEQNGEQRQAQLEQLGIFWRSSIESAA